MYGQHALGLVARLRPPNQHSAHYDLLRVDGTVLKWQTSEGSMS